MKAKFFSLIFVFFIPFLTHSQTVQDTLNVTIETRNGGKYTGHIISETKDTVKIETETIGIVSIATNEIVNHNLIKIETNDGNVFLGEIIGEDPAYIKLKTKDLGEITISKSNIKLQQKVEYQQMKAGKYWFPNPQSTRYFWSPNGYGLKKGEGYYQNIWVLWNQFAYGLTDNFSVGAGIIPIFLFGAPTPVFATAKFSIPVVEEKFNVAGGTIVGGILGESGTTVGLVYGLATVGSHDANVSLGIGYGFAGGELAQAPAININGMFRVSSKGYIITENYILSFGDETIALVSFGGRSIIRKVALDYGLFIPFTGYGIEVAIPWLGFTIPIGKSN